MARRLVNAFAADHDDIQLVNYSASTGVTAPTLQATSPAPNSYAPPSGAMRWIRLEGGTGSKGATVKSATDSSIPANYYAAENPISLTYVCLTFLIDKTLASGDEILIFNTNTSGGSEVTWRLKAEYLSSTTFRLLLNAGLSGGSTKATGTTTFTTLEKIFVRITFDGTNVTVHARENNSDLSGLAADSTVADGARIDHSRPLRLNASEDVGVGEYIWYDACGIVAADTGADRPDAAWVVNRVVGDGEGTAQDYGDDADCTTTDAVYGDVALDGSLKVVTSSYWCEVGGSSGSQEQTLASFTPSGTLAGITVHNLNTANLTGKSLNTWTRIFDASNTDEWANASIGVTDWIPKIACPELDPSGNEWADRSDLNAIGVGMRSSNLNGANDHTACQFIQTYEIGDDPVADLSWLQTSHRPRIIEPAIYAH